MKTKQIELALVVPTLNAGPVFVQFLDALRHQTLRPAKRILLESESTDNTELLAKESDFDIHSVLRRDFDHGGTRQHGVGLTGDADILIFLTQDAILAHPESLANIVKCFTDEKVGAVCGRQLPHVDATPVAAHARLFNYPEQSRVKSYTDTQELGIKTAFISNSFAAYRRTALEEVGGFPSGTLFGEDTIVAARMLKAGWKVAYCAEAQVYHSHNYGMLEEFRRYFDVGAFHAREPWYLSTLGKAEGEGKRFVISELRFLLKRNPFLIPSATFRTGLKYIGYKLGKAEQSLPLWLKLRCSMNRRFWTRP